MRKDKKRVWLLLFLSWTGARLPLQTSGFWRRGVNDTQCCFGIVCRSCFSIPLWYPRNDTRIRLCACSRCAPSYLDWYHFAALLLLSACLFFSFLLLLDALLIPCFFFCLDTLWGKEIGEAVGGQLERASLDGHCRSLGLPRVLLSKLPPCLMLGMASMRSVHV